MASAPLRLSLASLWSLQRARAVCLAVFSFDPKDNFPLLKHIQQSAACADRVRRQSMWLVESGRQIKTSE